VTSVGALGLGYLDTPVVFWAAQLPGGLGAETRPDLDRVLKGEERAELADWQEGPFPRSE
jgi:hypothetical protein